ncbi:hypothetical protein AC578_298 [Pseudocercospora eumusae]|uniref:SAC domain-containing protein n=1 Tax=Pseudocercospora eumusae TaxID=321146 RepID=A0A139HU23_9PEZI|nr:hypothetical protein AC578_298 [Pseudocercospora eumusae]
MHAFGRASLVLLVAASIEVAAFGYLADGGSSGHKHMFHHQLQHHAKRAAENNGKPDLEHLLKRTPEDEEIAREYKRQLPDLLGGVLGPLSGGDADPGLISSIGLLTSGGGGAGTYIDVTGEHKFVPPGIGPDGLPDQRGPCPGLNSLANHNFISHTGIVSFGEVIAMTNKVFGMGTDVALLIAVMGTYFAGNPVQQMFSIGGPDPRIQPPLGQSGYGGLLGQPQGIDYSHNLIEADSSATRHDLYETGDAWTVDIGLFKQMYYSVPEGQLITAHDMARYKVLRFKQSIATNKFFYHGPYTGGIASNAGYLFAARLFANHSGATAEGELTHEILKSIFGVVDYPHPFTYNFGWERIPYNWYRRAGDYSLIELNLDLVQFLLWYPETHSIGGNTGKVNSFAGIDFSDPVSGILNLPNFLLGNNLICFALEIVKLVSPNYLNNIYATLFGTLGNIGSGLGCPVIPDLTHGGVPIEAEMSGLAKKLFIFAAVDGLLLQPTGQRLSTTDQSIGVKIEYGTNKITAANEKADHDGSGLESHGIVGLLNLVTSSYLIAIVRRKEVASIRDSPVFLIRDVALIPLSSRADAQNAISKAQAFQKSENAHVVTAEPPTDVEDAGEETETRSINEEPEDTQLAQKNNTEEEARALEPPKKDKHTTIVKDVVQNKGRYGRLVSRWFSKNGSQANARREQGFSDAEAREDSIEEKQVQQEDHASLESAAQDDGVHHAIQEATQPDFQKGTSSTIEHLVPRILKTARLYFSSSGFYFSYDHDLSVSLSRQTQDVKATPMWQRFDPLFFWNRHLMEPFVNAGHDELVLPLLQGFVGQRAFTISQMDDQERDVVTEADGTELTDLRKPLYEDPKHDLLLTLISRRSVKRAGLRYLRRGIDDEGNVANSVETEQILSEQSWNLQGKTFSLVQTRGSMPLFFSQSPYSFKPTPVFFGSEAMNQAAMKRHFAQMHGRYGEILYAASLVDKHGTEVAIGEKYEQGVKQLNEAGGINGKPVNFEWFDFHGACKGMRFENVSILLETLSGFLTSSGWTVKQNGDNISMQNGVLRTNCMDCLDRTNVVQSAVAGAALEHQLAELGLNINLKSDPKTQWFNTLWADNGDAISKQYAGTSALKGDFTRTRKRNWTGALTDFSLTLNRYYNNIFGDYFLQTNIDYFLGADPQIFDDFETDMTSQDYALDMTSMRQNAIDMCVKVVLEEPGEKLIGAWTLACPAQGNTLRSLPFEECVLLLTEVALYHCRIDWKTDKVGSFERVDLLDIKEIWQGAYVTSALGSSHLSETRNVGFVVRYADRGPQMRRTNTRSMSIATGAETQEDDSKDETKHEDSEANPSRILAFKALPPRPSPQKSGKDTLADVSELEAIRKVTADLQQTIANAFERDSDGEARAPKVQEHDVISAADAKKSTGYVESIGYSLKRLQFDVYPFIATERFAGKLKGKIVVVVGASTGIGKAIALAFAAAGASLALVARRKTLLDELVAEIEYRYQAPATAIQADILNEDTPQKIILETKSHFGGPIDILINNAAQHLFGRFHDLDFSAWWSRMETSFKAPLAITHTVLRELMIPRKSGIIINVSSTNGAHDIPFQTAYAVPKTAMLKFHQNLSWELEPYNILTFSVHPGNVMTEMVQSAGEQSQEYFSGLPEDAMTEKVMGTFGLYQGIEWQKPQLAANTIVTLCSEERCKILHGRYVDAEQDLEKVLEAAESGRVERERLYWLKVDQV